MLSNQFNIPDRCRSLVTPSGTMIITGGYLPLIDSFCKNTFIFDEHRALLVGRKMMKYARADHALHFHQGKIYAIGGTAANEDGSI